MSEKVILYLHASDTTLVNWVKCDAEGNVLASHTQIATESSLPITEETEVIVIVPAEFVLMTRVQLPKMSRAKLAKALPYALEEQLIDEVESLHFAYPDQPINGYFPVAVVAREKMNEWMQTLNAWGVRPTCLLPMTLALPISKDHWSMMRSDAIHVVRLSEYAGFAADNENLLTMMNLAIVEGQFSPSKITIFNTTEKEIDLRVTSQVEVNCLDEKSFYERIACEIHASSTFNLLQGQYAIKRTRFLKKDKMVSLTMRLAYALLAIILLSPIVSLIILNQRMDTINDAIAIIYQHNFPTATSMVAPKMRLGDKLQKLTSEGGENRLLILMTNIGNALKQAPDIKIKNMNFQNGELNIVVNALNAEAMNALTNALTQQGLNVKQQNAELNGTRVMATIQVE